MKVSILQRNKSISAGLQFFLPQFSVITGLNGSGKSHLLEAMASQEKCNVSEGNERITNILHIPFNGLNPQISENTDAQSINQNVNNTWNQIKDFQLQLKNQRDQNEVFEVGFPSFVRNRMRPMSSHLISAIEKFTLITGRSFEEITQGDVVTSSIFSELNYSYTLFQSSFAAIFKAYQIRFFKNQVNELRATKYNICGVSYLSDDEFKKLNGPPPWELVNQILAALGLSYRVSNPGLEDIDSPFQMQFLHGDEVLDMTTNDLSTGEKVLMSLVLAIYNSQLDGQKPELLLLDEPDAALHPSFSKIFIETLKSKIISTFGIKVVLTTHSPSTVAICDDETIFEINSISKIPVHIGKSRALNILTVGIPHLNVRNEARRQIFVESKYDVQYYQSLANILNGRRALNYDPVFLEVSSSKCNCEDVKNVTAKMSGAGNDLVRGLIDYDGVNKDQHPIYTIGGMKRYAIENYILEPIYFCLMLMHVRKNDFSMFNLPSNLRISDATGFRAPELQRIIDAVLLKIGISLESLIDAKLECGETVKYPREFFEMNGHKYEERLKKHYAEVGEIVRGRSGDHILKMEVIETIADYPKFLSIDIRNSFMALS